MSAIDVQGGGATEAVSPMEKETRKREAEDYSHASTKHWKQHFILLEEFHESRAGKRGHRLGQCKYCLEASDNPTPEQRELIVKKHHGRAPKAPPKMQIYARICQVHLSKCVWAPRDVKLVWQVRRGGGEATQALKPAPSASGGRVMSRSSVASSAAGSVASSAMDIRSFAVRRGLLPNEIATFQRLIFNLVIDTCSPFTFPEEPTVEELVDFLRPGAAEHLPSRRVISGRMLSDATAEAQTADEYYKGRMRELGYMESLTIDGWKDTAKIHIEGVLLMIGHQSYMEESEIAGAEHHGIAAASMIEKLYSARATHLCSAVLDEAGQISRAKRIIRRRHPHWVLDNCWAHQISLMVKALLKEEKFATVTDKASKIASALQKSSAKWAKRFYDIVDDIYERDTTLRLMTLGTTRWNSAQGMFASQLRVRTACKLFCLRFAGGTGDDKYPKELDGWQDNDYWKDAQEAELMIRPFVEASFVLQCNGRTKADVMLVLLNMFQHLNGFAEGSTYANTLTFDIERRWRKEEQHLYLLAFALHPKYRSYMVDLLRQSETLTGNWGTSKNVFSVARLVMAAKFYFAKHRVWRLTTDQMTQDRCMRDEEHRKSVIHDHARMLGIDMRKWLQGGQFADGMTHEDYNGGHPVEFWQDQVREHFHISKFAQWLLSQAVQSASCERLFKEFMQFHTKARNKTKHSKVHQQAQVRRHIQRTRDVNKNKDAADVSITKRQNGKNRFVNPEERKKKEDANEQAVATMCARTSGEENTNAVVAIDDASEQRDVSMSSDDEANEDIDEDEADGEEWIKALQDASPGDVFYEDDHDNGDGDNNDPLPTSQQVQSLQDDDDDDAVAYYNQDVPPEFCCEEVWTDPPALPVANEANYPQEDRRYFQSKKEANYVRNDKITLDSIVSVSKSIAADKLPSLRTVYQDRVQVVRQGW